MNKKRPLARPAIRRQCLEWGRLMRRLALRFNPPQPILTAFAVAGAFGVAVAFCIVPRARFWMNWIHWTLFLLTIGLGSLFWVALEYVVGARWSIPLRRVFERLAGLLLPAGAAALTALLSLTALYPWIGAEAFFDPTVAEKAAWRTGTFFSWRVAACVALWTGSFWILVHGSLRQDGTGDPGFSRRARRFAPAVLVVFAVTLSAAAYDWISSLEPAWHSGIFGILVIAGAILAGVAAATLGVLILMRGGRLREVTTDHLYNLGAFLFAFALVWASIGFAQYLVMWYANIPGEVGWYVRRFRGAWGAILVTLAISHFLIPFCVLLPRAAKGDPKVLVRVAPLLLAAHSLDLYWMLFPALEEAPVYGWPELSFAALFLGGGLLWVRWSMSWGEDMPAGDSRLREGLEFRL